MRDEHAPEGHKVQKQYDTMWNIIRDEVITGLTAHVNTKRLVITGISLGGALACLSFVDIFHSGLFGDVEVITFGAPRVGNKKWSKWFDTLTDSTRLYILDDPIPFMPRCLTLLCNYGQTGQAYVCDKKNLICSKATAGEE